MIEEFRVCEWCGEYIEQGRTDKKYCDKRCYNRFKNFEYQKAYAPIKKNIEAYKRSYKALSSLIKEFGSETKIKLSKAVQMGLNRNSPCLVVELKQRKGSFSQIGNLAYQVSSNLQFIKIYIISDGRGH